MQQRSVAPEHRQLLMELRSHGVTDTGVLSAVERVPREIFVPDSFKEHAYENTALPIGMGQTISQPSVVAFMTQALELTDRMKVLEVGTGSGYQAAILSKLARRVYTIERHKGLLREAERRFGELKLRNVVTKLGDGSKGWPEQAPFDRILVTAAATEIPPALDRAAGRRRRSGGAGRQAARRPEPHPAAAHRGRNRAGNALGCTFRAPGCGTGRG